MADDKKVQVQTQESGSSGNPPKITETEFIVGQPPQPPQVTVGAAATPKGRPFRFTGKLPAGKNIFVQLGDGSWIKFDEAQRQGLIRPDMPMVEVSGQTAEEIEKERPTITQEGERVGPIPQQQAVSETLAHPIVRTRTRVEPRAPEYSPEDTQKIEGWKKVTEQLPAGPQKTIAQEMASHARQEAEENLVTKNGPIKEQHLSEVADMYGQFKRYYYEGIADFMHQRQEKIGKQQQIEGYAHYSQESQIYAVRYGMSSLTNLHQGLDLAAWNFFFKTLGPLGSYLEKFHHAEIGFNMGYLGGRWVGSPYRFEYLIKTLPEEKAADFILDITKQTLCLVGKIGGPRLVSKTFDMYGRPKKAYVFTPLVKLQHNLFSVGNFLDRVTTEKTIRDLQEELKRATTLSPGNKTLHDIINGTLRKEQQKINWHILPTKNEFLPRVLRGLGVKGIAKNLRHSERDPLSFIAILIGQWLFDVTLGNIISLVAEKITSLEAWQKFTAFFKESPLVQNLQASLGVGREFVSALPSLNTAAGGFVGYNLGGAIGQNIASAFGLNPAVGFQIGSTVGAVVGGAGGWGYQWSLNLAKNPGLATRMLGVQSFNFFELSKEINTKIQLREFAIKELGGNSFAAKFLDNDVSELTKFRDGLFTNLNAPGPMMRFANWLNSPIGQFFRIPIKGLAVSQLLSPFEAQIQQAFPFYQGWMPPAAEWLWETKGAFWNMAFKPTFGRLWEFSKFSGISDIKATPADLHLIAGEAVPGIDGLSVTNIKGTYLLDVSGARLEGLEFQSTQPRWLYQQYINFRTGLNEILGSQSALQKGLVNFFEEHQTLTRFVKGMGKVGLTNFAGFLVGFEMASFFTGGNLLASLAGGVGGWFLANPILTISETLLEKFGLFPVESAVSFVNLFNTGFWLGAGVQFVAGFFGISLPFWFPLAAGLTFTFLPSILIGVGGLIQPFVAGAGSFLIGFGTSAAGTLGGLAAFSTVVGIASVAALSVFAIVVIGSAFWIPIKENLAGLTAVSPCFDISSPTFTDNAPPIFTKGQKREVCWTTTNKQPFYQDAITKTKTWNPPSNFTYETSTVTIHTPDGQSIVWNSTSANNQPGGYKFSALPVTVPDPNNQMNMTEGGYQFNITPPKDTGGLYKAQMAQEISGIVTQIKNGDPAEELMAQPVYAQIYAEMQRDYVLKPALSALQAMNGDASKTKPLQDAINGLAYPAGDITDRLNGFCPTNACYAFLQNICTPAPQDPTLLSKCNVYRNNISKDYAPEFKNQMQNILGPIITGVSPAQIQDQISSLQNQIGAITDKGRDGARAQINLVNQISSAGLKNKTGTELQTAIDNMAAQFANSNPQNYLPVNSTITVCLTLKYNGEDGKTATLTEKDAAVLPVIGPLQVPSCQAQLITPINAAGPGNLQWPTDKRGVPGFSYGQPIPNSLYTHKGVDLDGTPGSPVKAAGSGTIIKESYEQNGFGYYAIIQGDDGNYYIYAHMGQNNFTTASAFANKNVGDKVIAGDTIGYFGSSGDAIGPHLHFGVSTQPDVSSFYNNSTTTLNPCGFFQGGCP